MTGAVRAVDVGDLTSAAQIDALMASLRTGFVSVRHPLTPGLLDDAYRVVRHFFALPPATKERYRPEDAVNAGYRGLQAEQAVGAGRAAPGGHGRRAGGTARQQVLARAVPAPRTLAAIRR